MASNSDNTSTTVGNALPQEKPEKLEKPTEKHSVRENPAPAASADMEKPEKPEKPEKSEKPAASEKSHTDRAERAERTAKAAALRQSRPDRRF